VEFFSQIGIRTTLTNGVERGTSRVERGTWRVEHQKTGHINAGQVRAASDRKIWWT
jgi:hypothetical protein